MRCDSHQVGMTLHGAHPRLPVRHAPFRDFCSRLCDSHRDLCEIHGSARDCHSSIYKIHGNAPLRGGGGCSPRGMDSRGRWPYHAILPHRSQSARSAMRLRRDRKEGIGRLRLRRSVVQVLFAAKMQEARPLGLDLGLAEEDLPSAPHHPDSALRAGSAPHRALHGAVTLRALK